MTKVHQVRTNTSYESLRTLIIVLSVLLLIFSIAAPIYLINLSLSIEDPVTQNRLALIGISGIFISALIVAVFYSLMCMIVDMADSVIDIRTQILSESNRNTGRNIAVGSDSAAEDIAESDVPPRPRGLPSFTGRRR